MAGEVHGMGKQKMLATVQMLRSDENLGGAVLVALGTLFLLLTFTFYPIYLVPVLAALAGAVAYRKPPLGTILGMFLAFPAVAYQAPVLAWVFCIALAITLFEAFDHWSTISFLQLAILAPFAPEPFSLVSGFLILLLGIAALRFGSRHSFAVSLPAVFIVLLLSTIWLHPTASFITISESYSSLYGPALDPLMNNAKPEVGIADLVPESGQAIASLFAGDNIRVVSEALGLLVANTGKLFISDFALVQLFAWAAALFALAMLPPIIEDSGLLFFLKPADRSRYKQTIASLMLFIIPITNYFLAPSFRNPLQPLSFAYCAASVCVIAAMEYNGISLSRERIMVRRDKQKTFGKFGVQDLSESDGVDSLADVGGYEDVKTELRESIVSPIKQKELTYTYGIRPPTGILFFGPPGTGKTLLMKALAKELDIGFYYVKCSDLLSEWYGESLPYDEKIAIMEGGRIRLEEIGKVVENKLRAKVLSFCADGRTAFVDIGDYFRHECTSPIYEVRTRTGRRIRVTRYHSLFTLYGCTVKSVKTSELVPGVSYIAIPSKIPQAECSDERMEFLRFLRGQDYKLKVRNAQALIGKAIKALGEKRVCEILLIRRIAYLRQIIRKNIGVRASRFLCLMEKARVEFDAADVEVFAGKRGLPGTIPINGDFALFLGLWVAEGSYNAKHTVRISTSDKEVGQVSRLCHGLFGSATVYEKKGSNGRDIYIGSRALYVLMRHHLGLKDGAENKKAPEIAFSFSDSALSTFLRGYFSGDGCVYANQKGFGTVEASTVSRTLADQLLYLLLRFGIVATVYGKDEKHGLPASRICMTGEPMRLFSEKIGFVFEGKSTRLSECTSRGKWHRGHQIPIAGRIGGFVGDNLPDHCKCATVGAGMLSQLAGENGDAELSSMLSSDIFWDRVEKITRVRDEKYVYDISVEPCQNFAGGFGGIFAHNSEKNVSEVFTSARKNAPCVLFFDEIDSIGKRRDSYTSDDVAPRIMSVLLQELDGFRSKKNVITIGATNIPDQLDPALMRPGRFDKIIYMPLPDIEARKAIFKVHLKKLPVEKDVDFDRLALMTERYSGADIKNICTEGSRLAAREAMKSDVVVNITMKHLTTIIKKVKPSVTLDMVDTYSKFRMDYERRSEAPEKKPDEKGVRWEDVAGLTDVRTALLESIEIPLLHEDLMKEMDVKPSKGLLLFGPPGCGKTMIVKAATNELNANFLTISGSELMRGKEKNPASYVKEIFNRARESAPALVFIDEIEALAPTRDEYRGGILTELLQELDGVKELKNVMLVGATNKPSALDSAILRPGRFDKILYIPPPDEPARKQIFANNLAKFLEKIDLNKLAGATEGFSGADIASICQEIKMQQVRDRLSGKSTPATSESVLKVISTRRPSITQKDLREYFTFMEEYGERK